MLTGDLIKQARLKAGMTQAELAKKLSVTPQAISQYERNLKKPKLETVVRLAEALGVCVPDLYPEGTQSLPILEWMESRSIPIVSGPPAGYWDQLQDKKEASKNRQCPSSYEHLNKQLLELMDKLNSSGKMVALERLEELAQIPKYQRQPAPAAPQEPPASAPDRDPKQE